jgi:phosphate transport system substrate-binding protein
MKFSKRLIVAAIAATSLVGSVAIATGQQIHIVGSSTVFPFATAVAEQFAARGQFQTPRVESTGTGGGMSLFCRGVGDGFPDITNASRAMRLSEYQACQRNGVREIVEVKIGYDGIVLSNAVSGPDMAITKQQLFMALAKELPSRGRFIPNPFTRWSQIAPGLPDVEIDVMGPPPTSGTRDAFNELALEAGARQFAQMENLRSNNEGEFKRRATTIREDGKWKDGGENDNLIVQSLARNPNMYGVFGFSFYEENMDRVQAATINGVRPTFDSIANGSYAVSRSMYFYIKKAHIGVTAGLKEYAEEFLSDRAAGSRGYLRGRGMVPLSANELAASRASVASMTAMRPPRS